MALENYECRRFEFKKPVMAWLTARHYTGSCPTAIKEAFGLFEKGKPDTIVGVCIFSPFTRLRSALKYKDCIDLSRLFIEDTTPKNAESFLLGYSLRYLQKHTKWRGVIAFADPTAGHSGSIYKAANFTEVGQSGFSYHYRNSAGEMVNKRGVWDRSRKENRSELDQARYEGLIKVAEMPKKVFCYPFDEQILQEIKTYAPVKPNYTADDRIARECVPDKVPDDFDVKLHCAIRIAGDQFLIDRIYLDYVLKSDWFPGSRYMTLRSGDSMNHTMLFHKMVVPVQGNMVVDHINRNKRDNRTCNLRVVSQSCNNQNSSRRNSSGFMGVRKVKSKGRKGYEAKIGYDRKPIYCGYHQTAIEAAIAYDRKAVEIFGSNASTNFPIENYVVPEKPIDSGASKSNGFKRNFFKVSCSSSNCGELAVGETGLCTGCLNKQARRIQAAQEGRQVTEYADRVKKATETCTSNGCKEKVFARNLCSHHWREARKAEGKTRVITRPKDRCMVEDCGKLGGHRIGEKQWLCRKHYNAKMGIVTKHTGRPKSPLVPCAETGCEEMAKAGKGRCQKHYLLAWHAAKKADPEGAYPMCKHDGCKKFGANRIGKKHWLCRSHYNDHMASSQP